MVASLPMPKSQERLPRCAGIGAQVQRNTHLALVLLAGRPLQVRLGARTLTIDRAWWLRWPLSLRLWLCVGVLFHILIFTLFNVGMFTIATLSTYLLFLPARRLADLVQTLTRALSRRRCPLPEHLTLDAPISAEDPWTPA